MVEERRILPATTFSAMDPSSQIHWGPNRERQTGERIPQGEGKKHLCARANRQTVSRAQQGAEEQSAPCTQQSERGSRGKKKSRAGVTKTGKGGRRASWTWGFVWLLCGFYSSSVSPRLSWGDFGLQSRKVRAAADTNSSFKCIQLFTFVFSYKQTVKCAIWLNFLTEIYMCKCARQSLRSH